MIGQFNSRARWGCPGGLYVIGQFNSSARWGCPGGLYVIGQFNSSAQWGCPGGLYVIGQTASPKRGQYFSRHAAADQRSSAQLCTILPLGVRHIVSVPVPDPDIK